MLENRCKIVDALLNHLNKGYVAWTCVANTTKGTYTSWCVCAPDRVECAHTFATLIVDIYALLFIICRYLIIWYQYITIFGKCIVY